MSGITNIGKLIDDCAEILMYTCSISTPINGFLSGIILMQYFQYVLGPLSASSPRRIKALTTLATVSSFIDLVLTSVSLNQNAVTVVRTPLKILRVPILYPAEVACTFVSTICVQLYFTEVVHKVLDRSRLWLCVASILLCTSVGGGIGTIWTFATVKTAVFHPHQALYGNLRLALSGIWLSASAIFDITVSVILCVHLSSSLQKSVVKNTNDVLTYLLIGTLESFMLSSSLAIVGVLLVFVPLQYEGLAVLRFNAAGTAFTIFLGRVYTISLLYSVNRRVYVQQQMGRPMNTTVFPSSLSSGNEITTNGQNGSIAITNPQRRTLANKVVVCTEVLIMSGLGKEERSGHAACHASTHADKPGIDAIRPTASSEKDSPYSCAMTK